MRNPYLRADLNQKFYWFKSAIRRKSKRKWLDICVAAITIYPIWEFYLKSFYKPLD